MKRYTLPVVLMLSLVFVTGCKHRSHSHSYSYSHVGHVSTSEPAVIVSVRQVILEAEGGVHNNPTGTVLGAVTGGAIGSTIGSGRGNDAAIIGGAIVGGIIGSEVERESKTSYGMEYTIRLKRSGRMLTVVQGRSYQFRPGDHVLFNQDNYGRGRITPDYHSRY